MAPEPEIEPLSAQDSQGFDFDSADRSVPAAYPNAGHRERLRSKVLDEGAGKLHGYELLEFLLFCAIPRRDTKPLAKELIDFFGSFEDVVCASPDQLRQVLKKNDQAIALIKVIEASVYLFATQKVNDRDLVTSHAALLEYCRTRIANQPNEQFRVLYLDTKNRLIRDVIMGEGTIDHAPVYVRNIVERCLRFGAKSIILVHNHPSGDPTPSSADISMTKEIVAAAKTVGIAVHDHLVIGRNGHESFKARGLL